MVGGCFQTPDTADSEGSDDGGYGGVLKRFLGPRLQLQASVAPPESHPVLNVVLLSKSFKRLQLQICGDFHLSFHSPQQQRGRRSLAACSNRWHGS